MFTKKTKHEICYLLLSIPDILVISDHYRRLPNTVHKGYIVTKQGDTIHGMIDYREWDRNPKKIAFIPENQLNPTSYSVNDIESFRVKNEHYQAAIVEIEVSPRTTNELNDDAALQIVTDTVFLQAVMKGEKSLFAYVDFFGRENFYIEQNGGFELLVFKKYTIKQQQGQTQIAQNKKFIGQLLLYLFDCETIGDKLQKARYSRKSLESVFLDYYQCMDISPDVILKTQKLKIEKGFMGGVSLTTISFSGENEKKFLSEADFSSSTMPTLGFFMDVVLPRKQDKWSIYNEILFNSYQFSGGYTDFDHEEKYTDYEIEIGASYLSMSNMIRYRLALNRNKIVFNFGLSNGLLIASTNNKKSILHFFDTERIKEEPALESFRKFETGIAAGIGFSYNKLSMEIRGVWGNGMSPFSGLKSNTTRWMLLLAYQLN